ncbi:hypothetical protein [Streptomyces sp. H39-S7]|uniref:hypothetical protein n=1 Tax=Streptomyces sp. H39-S7 TaxID=3004357 RepID=UPI0022B0352C|nr:hypothetical protein [Streptomyces sp. H39-S7]MCZ4124965.1 hypothetical protein [Streptomyces sp. H39-S7]
MRTRRRRHPHDSAERQTRITPLLLNVPAPFPDEPVATPAAVTLNPGCCDVDNSWRIMLGGTVLHTLTHEANCPIFSGAARAGGE